MKVTGSADQVVVRHLDESDIPELLRLEDEKWGENGATRAMLVARLQRLRGYCWGALRGERLASSLFCMRRKEAELLCCRTWAEACNAGLASAHDPTADAIFGISLTGTDLECTQAIFARLEREPAARGVSFAYLGTPMPRLGDWLDAHPGGDPAAYAATVKLFPNGRRLPLDPQIAYYYQLGFRTVVSVRAGYFPHELSRDWAAFVRRVVGPRAS